LENYYQILGIKRSATAREVREAFKKMALELHPDKNPNNAKAEERFKLVNEAYQVLNDAEKRFQYNQKLDISQPIFSEDSGQYKSYSEIKHEPNFSSGDYSKQGKHFAQTTETEPKKESNTFYYIIAFTLIIIIGTAATLFGKYMNHISAKEHFDKAVIYFNSGNYFYAFRECNEALEYEDSYAEVYEMKGDIRRIQKKYKLALVEYGYAQKYYSNKENIVEQKITSIKDSAQIEVQNMNF
jgi:tetratricopeptide (TPR) repeat protein